jgi:hypothetical protein
MTDRSKFEEMLERLVNEDREGAEALFHEIVVERSREIYQSILESEDDDLEEASEDDEDKVDESDDEDLDESDDEELDESADEDEDLDESDDEDLDEMFGLDEFELEADPMGGDATDDMMGDMGMDMDDEGGMDMGDEEDGDVEDRLMDLEDALEELKAEFEAMMGGDDEGDMDDDGDMDMDDEGDDEEGDDDSEKEAFAFEAKKSDKKDEKKDDKKAKKTAGEEMREYVEKVNGGFGAKIGGDNGANSKSIVASKNDMGGTTANILRTDTENSGEAAKGHLKGSSLFKGTPKEDNAGNMNVPGAKAGKTAFKKSEPGHGAEKKGKPETADKGAHSTIKGVVRTK